MHGTTRSKRAPRAAGTARRAVTWIDRRSAIVASIAPDGALVIDELTLPTDHPDEAPALAHVADAIGDVERVLVLGPVDMRTALERELVAIDHHPERIRDEAMPIEPPSREDLAELLRSFADR